MLLWFWDEFLNTVIQKLQLSLQLWGNISRLSKLKTTGDVLKEAFPSFLRTKASIKEKNKPEKRQIVKRYLGWDSNVNIWVNQREVKNTFEMVAGSIQPSFLSYECSTHFPTTRKHKTDGLMLTELYHKIFTQDGLAVRGEMIYKRIEGTRFSWEPWKPLENWITDLFTLEAPTAYLDKLKDNTIWLAKGGKVSQLAPKFQLFPPIKLELFMVEFKDLVYEFSRGQTIDFDKLAPQTAIVCHVNERFDECRPPLDILALLGSVLYKVRTPKYAKSMPFMKAWDFEMENSTKESRDSYLQENQRFNPLLKGLNVFGGLLHPSMNELELAITLGGTVSKVQPLSANEVFKEPLSITKEKDNLDLKQSSSQKKRKFFKWVPCFPSDQ